MNMNAEHANLEAMLVQRTVHSIAQEQPKILQQGETTERCLATQSAGERKFDLLNADLTSSKNERTVEFIIVDMNVLKGLFACTNCGQCGANSVAIGKESNGYVWPIIQAPAGVLNSHSSCLRGFRHHLQMATQGFMVRPR